MPCSQWTLLVLTLAVNQSMHKILGDKCFTFYIRIKSAIFEKYNKKFLTDETSGRRLSEFDLYLLAICY